MKYPARLVGTLCFTSIFLSLALPVEATVFCVETAPQLTAALEEAETNGVSDRILLTTGQFNAPSEGFSYDSPNSNESISLEGGFGPQCSGSGQKSLIDGAAVTSNAVVHMAVEGSDVTVTDLIVRNFSSSKVDQAAFGIFALAANVTLDGNLFTLTSGGAGSLHVFGFEGSISLRNNVFTANQAGPFGVARVGGRNVAPFEQHECEVVGNTFTNNYGDGDAFFEVFNCEHAVVFNNVFWGNDGNDLILSGEERIYELHHNDIEDFVAQSFIDLRASENIAVDPQFDAGLFNFTPSLNSPLVDAGTSSIFDEGGDFARKKRRNGVAPDIGAFERQTDVFRNGFD